MKVTCTSKKGRARRAFEVAKVLINFDYDEIVEITTNSRSRTIVITRKKI